MTVTETKTKTLMCIVSYVHEWVVHEFSWLYRKMRAINNFSICRTIGKREDYFLLFSSSFHFCTEFCHYSKSLMAATI